MVCLPLPTLQGKFKDLNLKLYIFVFYKHDALLLMILITMTTSVLSAIEHLKAIWHWLQHMN